MEAAPPKPRLQDTILTSLEAGKTVTVGEVCSLLDEKGIHAKRDVVYATLFRLAGFGLLTKVSPGVYLRPHEKQQPILPPDETGE
jgi:Fe2+ or Zn2+ uptake regulation protein